MSERGRRDRLLMTGVRGCLLPVSAGDSVPGGRTALLAEVEPRLAEAQGSVASSRQVAKAVAPARIRISPFSRKGQGPRRLQRTTFFAYIDCGRS